METVNNENGKAEQVKDKRMSFTDIKKTIGDTGISKIISNDEKYISFYLDNKVLSKQDIQYVINRFNRKRVILSFKSMTDKELKERIIKVLTDNKDINDLSLSDYPILNKELNKRRRKEQEEQEEDSEEE